MDERVYEDLLWSAMRTDVATDNASGVAIRGMS